MRIQRSMSAGNKGALLLSLVGTAILSLLPISAHATVDWNEGFEYANAEFASGTITSKGPIALSTKGRHAHLALLHLTGHGVVH